MNNQQRTILTAEDDQDLSRIYTNYCRVANIELVTERLDASMPMEVVLSKTTFLVDCPA